MFGVPCICVLRCTRRVLKLPGFETSIKGVDYHIVKTLQYFSHTMCVRLMYDSVEDDYVVDDCDDDDDDDDDDGDGNVADDDV